MFKEQLHKSFDAISPSPELLDRISAMMSEEAAHPKPSIKMTAVKYGGIAAVHSGDLSRRDPADGLFCGKTGEQRRTGSNHRRGSHCRNGIRIRTGDRSGDRSRHRTGAGIRHHSRSLCAACIHAAGIRY